MDTKLGFQCGAVCCDSVLVLTSGILVCLAYLAYQHFRIVRPYSCSTSRTIGQMLLLNLQLLAILARLLRRPPPLFVCLSLWRCTAYEEVALTRAVFMQHVSNNRSDAAVESPAAGHTCTPVASPSPSFCVSFAVAMYCIRGGGADEKQIFLRRPCCRLFHMLTSGHLELYLILIHPFISTQCVWTCVHDLTSETLKRTVRSKLQ